MDATLTCWEGLEDPRTGSAQPHEFHDLLTIALCTVGCGGQTATDMPRFFGAKETYLRDFIELCADLSRHDAFSRWCRLLDPVKFSAWFRRFIATFGAESRGVIAVDGKALRRSHDKARGKSAPHMVSALSCEVNLVAPQIATDVKSNRITTQGNRVNEPTGR